MNDTSDQRNLRALLGAELDAHILSGVRLSLSGRRLTVRFAHVYLSAYWLNNYRNDLEEAACNCLGQDLTFVYLTGGEDQLPPPPQIMLSPPAATDFFADFLTNDKNDLALRAARELCDPQTPLMSLLMTGESGSGKSHLLGAIAKTLSQSLGTGSVLLTSADNLPSCRFWRQGKALLADDIQLLFNNFPAQELLAAHFDAASASGNFLILTCTDGDWTTRFSGRLRQRLQTILQVSLHLPDLFLRTLWLEKQNERRGLGLNNNQILALARRGRHISQLSGILQKFEFYGRMANRQWAWERLEKLAPPEQAQPWLRVFALVSARFGVTEADMLGPSRRREIVFARQAAMYLARKQLGLSYPELGRLFGGRDHATVIHSINKIEQLLQVDKDLHNMLTELAQSLY